MEKNYNEQIFELFYENPHKVYSPKKIANGLKIKYDTVESALRRFVLEGKIQQLARGKYVLEHLPEGQSTFDKMKIR